MSLWMRKYAFDVIGELTYSSKHGFLESGEDIDGIIAYLTQYMDYLVVVTYDPWRYSFSVVYTEYYTGTNLGRLSRLRLLLNRLSDSTT